MRSLEGTKVSFLVTPLLTGALLLSLPAAAQVTKMGANDPELAATQHRLCAALDIHHVIMIEGMSDRGATADSVLADASFSMLAGRQSCREGRLADALDTYTRLASVK
jgi:hypothetical protein